MEDTWNEGFLLALDEMYFGKKIALSTIEEYFDRLKAQYKNENPLGNGQTYRDLVNDPLLIKIGKEIANLFGFEEVAVTISRRPTFNAYTIPFVMDMDGNSYDFEDKKVTHRKLVGAVTITNDGFMFNKRKFRTNLLVCINLGCLFKAPITTSELLAVLLHEIGHNFSRVVLSVDMTDRADEKFADQFVSMYGYGPELASALSKTMIDYSDFDRRFKDVPLLNVFVGLNQIRKNLLNVVDDSPHPVTKNRLLGVVRQLEQDLKDTPNLTPTMKKKMQDQIAQTKRIIDDTFNDSPDANIGERITRYYFREMEPGRMAEVEVEQEADRFSAPTKVNQKMSKMVHKKGWFTNGTGANHTARIGALRPDT